MATSAYILGFSTSNYHAMVKIFRDFGFTVAEESPFFAHGRAAGLTRGGFEFQLEESNREGAKAAFKICFTDCSNEEIERFKGLGYDYEYGESVGGEYHSFKSPDGGTIITAPRNNCPWPAWWPTRLPQRGSRRPRWGLGHGATRVLAAQTGAKWGATGDGGVGEDRAFAGGAPGVALHEDVLAWGLGKGLSFGGLR